MTISRDIHILTDRDLDEIRHKEYLRGVERGKFESSMAYIEGPYARNCANWKDGKCEICGVQWQDMQVHADHKCQYFTKRR